MRSSDDSFRGRRSWAARVYTDLECYRSAAAAPCRFSCRSVLPLPLRLLRRRLTFTSFVLHPQLASNFLYLSIAFTPTNYRQLPSPLRRTRRHRLPPHKDWPIPSLRNPSSLGPHPQHDSTVSTVEQDRPFVQQQQHFGTGTDHPHGLFLPRPLLRDGHGRPVSYLAQHVG